MGLSSVLALCIFAVDSGWLLLPRPDLLVFDLQVSVSRTTLAQPLSAGRIMME